MNQQFPQPERVLGTLCGNYLGRGAVSFPCSRAQGHMSVPADDPEPCFAMEVPSSNRAWREWKIRQDERAKGGDAPVAQPLRDPIESLAAVHHRPEPEQVVQATVKDAHCDNIVAHPKHVWESTEDSVVRYCDGTGVRHEAVAPSAFERTEAPAPQAPLDRSFNDCGQGCWQAREHNPNDPACVMSPAPAEATLTEAPCPSAVQGFPHSNHEWQRPVEDAVPPFETVYCEGYVDPVEPVQPEPTKQREGDQILPTGSTAIADDQSLVIADIEARRQVGIERYGQAHVPLNGRNTMLDEYEELLDLLVYRRSLLRLREATRADLVEAVTPLVTDFKAYQSPGEMAEVVVDRVIDWVTMKVIENIEASASATS